MPPRGGRRRNHPGSSARATSPSSTAVALNHFFRPETESAATQWPASGGWQRELGLFVLGFAFLNAQVLRRRDADGKRMLLRTAMFLWPTLTANHLAALADGRGPTRIHVGASILNVVATAVAAVLLRADRKAYSD